MTFSSPLVQHFAHDVLFVAPTRFRLNVDSGFRKLGDEYAAKVLDSLHSLTLCEVVRSGKVLKSTAPPNVVRLALAGTGLDEVRAAKYRLRLQSRERALLERACVQSTSRPPAGLSRISLLAP